MHNFGIFLILLFGITLIAIVALINPMAAILAFGPVLLMVLIAAGLSELHKHSKENTDA